MSRITITDLAKITGFSKTTISHVINNTKGARIRMDTREKILDAAREHNYVPNFFARNIISGKTGYMGFLTHDIEAAMRSGELRGAEEACRSSGYHLAVFHAVPGESSEADWVETMIRQGIEALYADRFDNPAAALERFSLFNIHLVLGEDSEGSSGVDCVFDEERQGFEQLAERLKAFGHRSAALLSGGSPAEENLAGLARDVLRERGLSVHQPQTPGEEWPDDFGWLRADSGLPAPSVAICLSPPIALGIMTHLASQGQVAPADLSIVAAGGEPSFVSCLSPRLSFLRWPTRERARRAVERLIARLNAEPGATMPPVKLGLAAEWIEGQTLGLTPDESHG